MKRTAKVQLTEGGITRYFEVELPFYYFSVSGKMISRIEPDGDNLIKTSVTKNGIAKTSFHELPPDAAVSTRQAWLELFDTAMTDITNTINRVDGEAIKAIETEIPAGCTEILQPSQY